MEDEKNKPPERHICSRKLLAVHQGSRAISKPRPKIRIIHVFAPEIIKTDVENFRELVQRLTGKPPAEKPYQRTWNHSPLLTDCDPDGLIPMLGGEEAPLAAVNVSCMHFLGAAQLA
ncbi:hypothetical protein MLD38_019525 [Melastoma candidum]|uniref:Uncharacterized protein n=1 Tax=Melastoma candidum TaxID=119954 RepID=A0ACB9QXG4_9MYRT|nr:hypothetical protein MLD38_019525 [Melastoma candidum]